MLDSLRGNALLKEALRAPHQRMDSPHSCWSCWPHLLRLLAQPVQQPQGGRSPPAKAEFFEKVCCEPNCRLRMKLSVGATKLQAGHGHGGRGSTRRLAGET